MMATAPPSSRQEKDGRCVRPLLRLPESTERRSDHEKSVRAAFVQWFCCGDCQIELENSYVRRSWVSNASLMLMGGGCTLI
jgi:hypothetical protein